MVLRIGPPCAFVHLQMGQAFNVEQFVADLMRGKFDGRLTAELRNLSAEELEEVVTLMVAERSKKGAQSVASLSPAD